MTLVALISERLLRKSFDLSTETKHHAQTLARWSSNAFLRPKSKISKSNRDFSLKKEFKEQKVIISVLHISG